MYEVVGDLLEVFSAKGLHEFLDFCKAGSDPVHHIGDGIVFLQGVRKDGLISYSYLVTVMLQQGEVGEDK